MYDRVDGENKIFMVYDHGILNKEISPKVQRMFDKYGIADPFQCDTVDAYFRREEIGE